MHAIALLPNVDPPPATSSAHKRAANLAHAASEPNVAKIFRLSKNMVLVVVVVAAAAVVVVVVMVVVVVVVVVLLLLLWDGVDRGR